MRWFGWVRRQEIDDDVAEEIRSHLSMAAQERMAEGVDPETARFQAMKELGNTTLTIEDSRRAWRSAWLDGVGDLWKDVRLAIRGLAKSPGFTFIVVAVLTLGIGMNAAVFTLFKGLALKPLPGVEGSGSLAVVMSRTSGGRLQGLSYADYRFIRDHFANDKSGALAGLSGSMPTPLSLGQGRGGEMVWSEFVTGNYFELFGVRAELGRTLQPSDEIAPGRHPYVVLSDGLWRRAFGADPDIVGKTIRLNAYPLTVVGVSDPSFHGSVVSFDVEAYIPIMMAPQLGVAFRNQAGELLHDRKTPLLAGYGRLASGATLATVAAQAGDISKQLEADAPVQAFTQQLTVLPIWKSPFGAQTYLLPAVIVIGVMGGLLLVIVCANVAGLVLVRGVSRRGEIAMRSALGASRARILRLLLIENLVLAVPGTAAGLFFSSRAMPLMMSGAASSAPARLFYDWSVDPMVVAYAGSVALLSVLLFGLLPALRNSRAGLMSVINDEQSTRVAGRGRFRSALVISQVALSLLLLVGAGLAARSLDAARRADPGFDPENAVSVTLDVAPSGYDEARGRHFYEQLLDDMRRQPGVESASLAAVYPMTMVDSQSRTITVEGYHPKRDEDLSFLYNTIAPDYFKTLRISVEAGREFDRRDDSSSEPVAIVNDTFARKFWGSAANALGKRIGTSSGELRKVVGVARDIKYARINEAPRPYVYLPFFQAYRASMILHVRGAAGPVALLAQAREEIGKFDPDVPILDAKTLRAQTSGALGILGITAQLLLIFGMTAMGLAAMGIYGLISYTAKQSTHEIGIRMALGASHGNVVRHFMRRGLRLGVIGAALGMLASYVAVRGLASLLYGVTATDPLSFAIATALVLLCALLAAGIPAWRASRTDPVVALRHQ